MTRDDLLPWKYVSSAREAQGQGTKTCKYPVGSYSALAAGWI